MPFFGTIDPMESDPLGLLTVHDFDGVAVQHAHHFAREICPPDHRGKDEQHTDNSGPQAHCEALLSCLPICSRRLRCPFRKKLVKVLPGFRIDHQRFHAIFLGSHPSNNGRGHINLLVRGQRHRERTDLTDTQGEITGEAPAHRGDIPDHAEAFELLNLVGHGAAQGDPTEGTNGEVHEDLAGGLF
ncbi:protein of unknown function [Nitrospira japonica]|uniref:Uncharacterized protein n=1 Tax=Nitrospira japonica TaxID=1325564 RepID=A0A1W1I1U2_9BACT|nr:protein of unknown function [Nitrospira japonica]